MKDFNKDEGRPEGFSYCTSVSDAEFEQMLSSFESIYPLKSQLRRRWTLAKVAPYFGIPRAEFRKLFELFCLERDELMQGQGEEQEGVK